MRAKTWYEEAAGARCALMPGVMVEVAFMDHPQRPCWKTLPFWSDGQGSPGRLYRVDVELVPSRTPWRMAVRRLMPCGSVEGQ